ncbi:MAG: oligosaccharide flippase family protein [Alphaproteobacteria bacterium]|nr:oligosaccharide flippase family protein [Alphaproteobacteria bacterium]
MAANAKPAATQKRQQALGRIGGQGAMLMAGFAGAQGCSFLRNAILGHWLSQGDFGIAAAITLMLQLVDSLSDIGADRLIIQAHDGDNPVLQSTAHTTLVIRGAITSLLLYLAAGPTTAFFAIPEARWAFECASLAPFLKGFLHLDARRYQRRLKNRGQVLIELLPQAAALALTIPLLYAIGDYSVIVWLSLSQALFAFATSHAIAERPYKLSANNEFMRRLIAFGWPIWLSAFPLAAVYQGDRMIVVRMLGIDELAAFTTAFMITMVPGLLAARVGNALMLPLLSEVRAHSRQFRRRFLTMLQITAILAATYSAVFIAAGGEILPIAFGANYSGLGIVVSWLAVMWAIRMLQAVPGMALMAKGDTQPLLWAGLVRATGLPLAIVAIELGHGLAGAAVAAALSEGLSLIYVMWRTSRHAGPDLTTSRSIAVLFALAATSGLSVVTAAGGSTVASLLVATLLAPVIALAGLFVMPSSNTAIRKHGGLVATVMTLTQKDRSANAPA